jgi:vesicle-associated membrane protein 7
LECPLDLVVTRDQARYEESPPRDALREAQHEIEATKNIMVQNVEQILSRGERLDLLVDKTDNLSTQSRAFRKVGRSMARGALLTSTKRSAAVRRRMWWKNTKLMLLSAFVVIVGSHRDQTVGTALIRL